MTIEAKAEEHNDPEKKEKYVHKERFYGVSTRSYYVGDVKESDVKAKYENGVLKLFVPKEKPEEPKEHRIQVL